MSHPSGPDPPLRRRSAPNPRASRSTDRDRRRSRGRDREPPVSRLSKTLERIAIVVVSFAIAIVAIALLSGYFTSQDPAGVTGSLGGPGLVYRDLGDARLAPGQARPTYDSTPPTSGPHVPTPVSSNRRALTDDQILTALAAGNVILIYGGATPPPGLAQLAQSTGGPFSAARAALGEAVILARLPGINGVIALAWTRMLPITGLARVSARDDAVLKQFIESWLGQGAPSSPPAAGNN